MKHQNTALVKIAEELKRSNDRLPRHPLEAPDTASHSRTPLNRFQQLAVAGYEGGALADTVSSLYDVEELNAPLLGVILEQLSEEHTKGHKEHALQKLDAMLKALQQARDSLESA